MGDAPAPGTQRPLDTTLIIDPAADKARALFVWKARWRTTQLDRSAFAKLSGGESTLLLVNILELIIPTHLCSSPYPAVSLLFIQHEPSDDGRDERLDVRELVPRHVVDASRLYVNVAVDEPIAEARHLLEAPAELGLDDA